MKETKVYAVFCGIGKTFLCNKFPEKYKEIECWEYRKGNFPTNYINEIKKLIGKTEILFISTDPVILKQLNKDGISIMLFYPDDSLKDEYMERYCNRKNSYDFIGVMYKHWNEWIDELKEQDFCEHIIIKKNEYLENILTT